MTPKVPTCIISDIRGYIIYYQKVIKRYNEKISENQKAIQIANTEKEEAIRRLNEFERFAKEMSIEIDDQERT